jgi:hypothetical protein
LWYKEVLEIMNRREAKVLGNRRGKEMRVRLSPELI